MILTEREIVIDENTLMEKLQQDGIMFDRQRYRDEIISEKQDELVVIENKIKKILGIPEPFSLYCELISRQALKNGICIKSFSLAWLMDHEKSDPIFCSIVKWKELKLFLKTYGNNLMAQLDENSRIHPKWLWNGTVTNRIISKEPCVQNFPRKIRDYFTAPPGHCLISADYSQIELRIMAEMSGDERLTQLFLHGGDLYKSVAATLLNREIQDISDDDRQKIKAITLGMLYGITSYGMVQNLEKKGLSMTIQEANQLQIAFFEQFPGIAAFQRQQLNSDTIKTLGGFEFHNIKKPNSKLALGIQGSSSEILKKSIELVTERLGSHIKIVMLLHDEIILETEHQKVAMVKEVLESSMIDGAKEYLKKTPIKIELKESKEDEYGK
ncbi:hypothetical protein GH808_14595 [Acetobacterium fimetarium]|uniref:DNA-directed DNA polymerase family A palm domain-containing protein n=1 Tax=Acetobacterium fimetarium TaxID=52691 RepID=A0ABR6WZP1_9FIRM|nr:DNA polymerase [Acetobacterium fimetarium]MBC3805636.1 hypothetical protein [Acetobacterium fimetarium]